jgi:hypothetical protein
LFGASKPNIGKSFIRKKIFFAGSLRMDMEKMLEIIETRAWVPRKKAEKEKAAT